jgi:hypothetical protein
VERAFKFGFERGWTPFVIAQRGKHRLGPLFNGELDARGSNPCSRSL